MFQGDQSKLQKMVQMSWTFVNDSLCTTLCLQVCNFGLNRAPLWQQRIVFNKNYQDWTMSKYDFFSSKFHLMWLLSVILSDPPLFKYGNALFTTVALKLFLINNMEDIVVFLASKVIHFYFSFFFSFWRNAQVDFVENPQLKIIGLQN